MPTNKPNISVCIPAYNRSGVLGDLLRSILKQDYDDYEIVVCEDFSRERSEIRNIVSKFMEENPRIKYFENAENLGFDNNIKELLRRSTGEYCVYMGNDDLMAEGALQTISSCLARNPDAGVFLRTYASFNDTPDNIDQVFRYAPKEFYLKPGAEAISFFFRRSVVIPGVTIHRELALSFETNEFDGSLLYQLYLVGMILNEKGGVYSPKVVTLYRNDGIPEFGNAASEKGKFVPTERTPESSLHFIASMLKIAKFVAKGNKEVFDSIFKDMSNYSYPFLSVQSDKNKLTYINYSYRLAKLGFYKSLYFWVYFLSILVLGTSICDKIIAFIKTSLGSTPKLGMRVGN